jgi:hypothetical protein
VTAQKKVDAKARRAAAPMTGARSALETEIDPNAVHSLGTSAGGQATIKGLLTITGGTSAYHDLNLEASSSPRRTSRAPGQPTAA